MSRSDAAREVALATELDSGHDATAEALDAGLVSPAHAAVIVQATNQLPDGVSDESRRVVETTLVEKASRFSPDQLRRIARRAIEAVEPDQTVVDAHENEQVRTEEQAAQAKCSFTMHDNGDGTSTGHFTVPALAAAILAKVLDTMTAPRRMREPGSRHATPDRSFDWRHRRGLAFAELLEHLPTDHLHPKTAATVVVTIDHTVLAGAMKAAQGWTPGRPSRPEKPDASPATPRSSPPSSAASPSPSTSATQPGSSPSRSASRKGSNTPPAPPLAANVPTPGASSTTEKPWAHGGKTDLANAIPLCHQHHQWIHDTGFNHQSMPDGSVRFSRRT